MKWECKDLLVRRVQLEQLVCKVLRGRKVQPVQPVQLEQQELQELQVLQELQELQGHKVQQDPLELQERLVLKVPQVLQLLGTTDRFMTQPHKWQPRSTQREQCN